MLEATATVFNALMIQPHLWILRVTNHAEMSIVNNQIPFRIIRQYSIFSVVQQRVSGQRISSLASLLLIFSISGPKICLDKNGPERWCTILPSDSYSITNYKDWSFWSPHWSFSTKDFVIGELVSHNATSTQKESGGGRFERSRRG